MTQLAELWRKLMIDEKINGDKWKQQVMKKLISFCEKCPCVLSIKTTSYQGEQGVFLIHKGTDTKYFFPWDVDTDPMSFVHNVKETIKYKHYPLLIENEYENHKLTSDELAKKVADGTDIKDLEKYERRVVSQKLWRIDKVVLWKDVAILERAPFKDEEVPKNQFRYKYNNSLVVFLKKYRSGEFHSLEEAGDAFFGDNSMLVNEIEPKQK